MTDQAILDAIPHREPFLLIDEIVERDDDRIVCRKTFGGDEWFYAGHYPGYPLTPGVLLCEACLQAGAVLLSDKVVGDDAVPVATRIDGVKFKQMVRPGDCVELTVTLKDRVGDAFFLTGQVRRAGKLAARLDFACTVAPPPGAPAPPGGPAGA